MDEFLHSPVEVCGAMVTIAFGVSAALRSGRQFWANLWGRLRARPTVPRETLRIVQDVHNSLWGHATMSGTPAMEVCFDGHVTEISGRPTRVLRVEISKPQTASASTSISNHYDARRPQVLQPHETADIRAVFFVQPVVGVDGKPWRATLIFIDQYGNRHN